MKKMQDVQPEPLAPPSIQVIKQDFNRDGKVDQFNITLSVRNPKEGWILQQANIIAAFEYKMGGNLELEALAHTQLYFSSSKNMGVRRVKTYGPLTLIQSKDIGTSQWGKKKRKTKGEKFFKLLEFQSSNVLLDEYYREANSIKYDFHKVIDYANPAISNQIEFDMVVKVPQR